MDNGTICIQSAVVPVLLEAERSVYTASHGALGPMLRAIITTWTQPTERSANPTQSSTGKEKDLYQSRSTPALYSHSAAERSVAQHAQTTPGQGNYEPVPTIGAPETETDDGAE